MPGSSGISGLLWAVGGGAVGTKGPLRQGCNLALQSALLPVVVIFFLQHLACSLSGLSGHLAFLGCSLMEEDLPLKTGSVLLQFLGQVLGHLPVAVAGVTHGSCIVHLAKSLPEVQAVGVPSVDSLETPSWALGGVQAEQEASAAALGAPSPAAPLHPAESLARCSDFGLVP